MAKRMMTKPLSATYLRLQADRCQRLSRMCMDLGTAYDLRMMADEYLADAARIEQANRSLERVEAVDEQPAQRQDSQGRQPAGQFQQRIRH